MRGESRQNATQDSGNQRVMVRHLPEHLEQFAAELMRRVRLLTALLSIRWFSSGAQREYRLIEKRLDTIQDRDRVNACESCQAFPKLVDDRTPALVIDQLLQSRSWIRRGD